MADEKFRKDLDRQAVLHDFKIRLIDLMQNHQPLPETDIYDEPVRYFKANLKWTPIIFGWLTWMQDVAGWLEANGEDYAGIQGILKFEEGIELAIQNCEDVEDCLGSSTIINNITTNITEIENNVTIIEGDIVTITNEVGTLTELKTSKNELDPATTYEGEDLCNASAYVAQRVLDNAAAVFGQKNSSDYATWIEDALTNGGGYIANALEGLWDAVNGNYANLLVELAASSDYVQAALFDNNMDRLEARTAILSDTHISAEAKASAAAVLAALTDGVMSDWAFVGKAQNYGGCSSLISWVWNYATTTCSYGLPTGWALTIAEGACGDGAGSFDGIWDTTPSALARVDFTITFPTMFVDTVHIDGFINGFHASNAGTLQVIAGATNNTQSLAQNPARPHLSVVVGELVSSVRIVATHVTSTQSPRGVVVTRVGIND